MTTTAEPADPAAPPARPDPGVPALRWGDEDGCRGGVRRRRFDVEHHGRTVPGLLWTPGGTCGTVAAGADAPRPLVLVGHGGSGHKGEDHVRALARRLVRRHGLAAAAIDGPVHGDRRGEPGAPPGLVLLEFAQAWAADGEAMTDAMVADWRATVDALQGAGVAAQGPVGWWGLSLGTILGLPFVVADSRVRVAVLGLMGLTGPTRDRIERDAPAVRCPVLFLLQWDDVLFPRDDALALFDALGTADKRLHAHPGGHGALPVEAFAASAEFLVEHLGAATASRTPGAQAGAAARPSRMSDSVKLPGRQPSTAARLARRWTRSLAGVGTPWSRPRSTISPLR